MYMMTTFLYVMIFLIAYVLYRHRKGGDKNG